MKGRLIMETKQEIANTNNSTDSIKPFKCKKNNVKKCWKYYAKKTKHDNALALRHTYEYIDSCYNETASISTNDLLKKFGELNKKHKYSYSIILSVVASFIITLLFVFLQVPDKTGLTYWEQIFEASKNFPDYLVDKNLLQLLVMILLFIIFNLWVMIVPICILIISYIVLDSLYYSTYRNYVVPYERKVILNKLISIDERFSELD